MTRTFLSQEVIHDLHGDISSSGTTHAVVIAPFTGEKLHDLPHSCAKDVSDGAQRARSAQLAWYEAGFAHRRAVLLKAHDLILERREILLDAVQSETGKARGQAFEEVFQAASSTRYYALSARRILAKQSRRGVIPLVVRTHVEYRPKGLIGIVTPWNYPLSLAAMDVVPALAAGNAVIQKADDQGALSILALRRAFIDAGVPADVWAVVTGPGRVVGNAVNDESDYVCFTGSTATGTQVGVRAAQALRGVSLELGGKNAMIVLDDVDPAKAAKDVVYACFSSMGQLCVSIERIYVERSVAEKFTEEFVAATNALVQGSAFDFTTDMGSLTLASQLERVDEHVKDAVAHGATVLAGGKPRPDLGPLFYEPTVLAGVTDSMKCFGEETFGPVVAITPVDSVEEAILAANATPFGLNASIFARSRQRAREVARALDTGSININEGYRATFGSVDAPMGGIKQSGLGRRNGPEGILRFVNAHTIAEATGLMALPRTGAEVAKLSGVMILLLVVLKAIRRR
ncbi:MAG: succinate-semialdehyde dehydrogenase (NADP(+)) [Microbacteriaceae bacterium]|nr:succinate-semialdehyde dehydrogenase (NADP(+)) [Microbacteriaceae bacterium]